MKVVNIVPFLALVAGLNAREIKRQSGPVDPSTDPDCSYYDTSFSETDDCAYFEANWGISHSDFVAWNPVVKQDCSGIVVGNSYCVEVTRPPPTPSTTTKPSATGTPKPSPTQTGLIESCTTFYKAVRGDTCDKILALYKTFTFAQFQEWNPAVGSDCLGLQYDVYYCVGIPGTPTAPVTTGNPTPTAPVTTGNPAPTGPVKPSPTQEGLISTCTTFYKAVSGDDCGKIVATYRTFTFAQFVQWNPAVGDTCSGLQANVYYCVGIPGTPTSPPATTTTPGNGIQTPQPTQPGMVSNCDAFYFVKSGDGCQVIADRHNISLTQLITWNDVGGSNCGGLQANVNVCVSIIGHTPTIITTKPSTTTQTNGIQTPQPTQPGMVNNCDAFYFVKSGDGCQAISDRSGISLGQFITWNDVGGVGCGGLQANVNVCVSVIGHTPTLLTTQPASTCATPHPTPTQPGAVCRCRKYHQVSENQFCADIQKLYGITATQFSSWNPQIASNCGNLFKGYYVCVGI